MGLLQEENERKNQTEETNDEESDCVFAGRGAGAGQYQRSHGEGLKPYVTLRQALGDLPKLASGEKKDYYGKKIDINNEFLP